ncbi:MAG: helicase-related protein [Vicinamibacterales bacterium]
MDDAERASPRAASFLPALLGVQGTLAALGRPPVLALVSTASSREGLQDLQDRLGLQGACVRAEPIYRPNLFLEARHVASIGDKVRALMPILSAAPGAGVVVADTIPQAETVYRRLAALGADVELEHGGLSRAMRQGALRRFGDGDAPILVTTGSLTAAADRPDIRWIAYCDLPPSPEAFWNMASRAGRDGRPARITVLGCRASRRRHQVQQFGRMPAAGALTGLIEAHARLGDGPVDTAMLAREASLSPRQTERVLDMLAQTGLAARDDRGRWRFEHTGSIDHAVVAAALDEARGWVLRHLEQMQLYCTSAGCRWQWLMQ